MKHRLHHLAVSAALMLGSLASAQSTGDVFFQTRPATPGPLEPGWLSKGNTKVIMFDASGHLLPVALGTGLTLTGSTLSSSASGGSFASLTGSPTDNTALATALGLKAPLASPTFTGTVTIPSGASISGYLTSATAASTYEPHSATLTTLSALANGAGVLTNDGIGGLSYTDTTAAASGIADAGKIITLNEVGSLTVTTDQVNEAAIIGNTSAASGYGVYGYGLSTGTGGGFFAASGSVALDAGGGPILRVYQDGPVEIRGATGGGEGQLDFYEADGNGVNRVRVAAPSDLAGNINFILPPTTGTAGYALITDGGGATSWSSVAASLANASVTNAKLANSAVTIGSTSVSLGATATTLAGLTSVTSTTFVGALTGNASTATTASTVTTNANLTGAVTSSGNATSLGSFTKAALNTAVSDDDVATLSGNAFIGANTTTLGTNSATPVTAATWINTTDSTVGVQSASPATIWQGEGWRSGNSTNHTLAYRAYTLPVQGSSADPTAEWRLGLSVDGGAVVDKLKVGADKTTITSTDTTGQVLSLAGYYATVNFAIGGSGDLHFNTIATFPSASGTRFEEYGNSANYIGVAASASQQILNTSSGTLRLGLPAASPASMTITGAGARVGTDANTSVTNAVNFAGPNGTGTGTGGKLDLGYIAPTTTGTAAGSFTSRIAINGSGEILVSTKAAPSSASDTGTAGEIRIAGGYLYYCSATNTWLRAALATW